METHWPLCINQAGLDHIFHKRLLLASVSIEFHLNERL
jgi:hypothetical protein